MKADQIRALAFELEQLNNTKQRLNRILRNFTTSPCAGIGPSIYGHIVISAPADSYSTVKLKAPNVAVEAMLNSAIGECLKRIAEIEAM